MKFMKYLALFSIIFFAFQMNAQLNIGRNVIGSAGSESSNLSLQVSFTIGESFTSTLTNNEIHTLGFQQIDQSMVSIVELSDDPIELYPNPAKEQNHPAKQQSQRQERRVIIRPKMESCPRRR